MCEHGEGWAVAAADAAAAACSWSILVTFPLWMSRDERSLVQKTCLVVSGGPLALTVKTIGVSLR